MLLIKLGPLTGQAKGLYFGERRVDQMVKYPQFAFFGQIRLDEVKAAAGEPWRGMRRMYWRLTGFDSNQGRTNLRKNSNLI